MSDDQNEEVLRSALGALSPVIQRAVAASRQLADRQQRVDQRNRTKEIEAKADESVEHSAEEEESVREEEEKSDGGRDMEAKSRSSAFSTSRFLRSMNT